MKGEITLKTVLSWIIFYLSGLNDESINQLNRLNKSRIKNFMKMFEDFLEEEDYENSIQLIREQNYTMLGFLEVYCSDGEVNYSKKEFRDLVETLELILKFSI